MDKATVRNIAQLARIELKEDELDHLAQEISGILSWVEQLQEVNTDGVEAVSSVSGLSLPQREDQIQMGGYPELILKNAPEANEGFFMVPKVVE